jgi:hypothetical protein
MVPVIRTLLLLSLLVVPQAVEPFNGMDLTGWKQHGPAGISRWQVGKASLSPSNPAQIDVGAGTELVNPGPGDDLHTELKFGDALIELEFMLPKGGRSGVVVMGEYEIRLADSLGVKLPGSEDHGAYLGWAPPKANASLPPGEWQKIRIEFTAPRFDAAGRKTSFARFRKVELNGTLIHNDIGLANVAKGGLTGKESSEGPLLLRGRGGAVGFRAIRISPLPAKR